MCRRYKYIFLYVGFLFVLSIVFIRLQSLKKPAKSYVNLQHVAVHIDLKGSPPKLTYLSTFLPSLNMYGVDTLVMEYEDMFPYNEGLINLSSINAYKRNEVSYDQFSKSYFRVNQPSIDFNHIVDILIERCVTTATVLLTTTGFQFLEHTKIRFAFLYEAFFIVSGLTGLESCAVVSTVYKKETCQNGTPGFA